MRCRLAHIVVLTTTCLCGVQYVRAQSQAASRLLGPHSETPCESSSQPDDSQHSGPAISIATVSFSGALQMPAADQNRIADLIKHETHGTSLDAVIEEALERANAGWQDRGYFKVHVNGEAQTLSTSPAGQSIALFVNVNEGVQYRLSSISFKNNRAITNLRALRNLFPTEDGDVFSREKIARGLENFRKTYGELGYINFTTVPDTRFDDEDKLISLDIDIDEGKQFYVRAVEVQGLDESSRDELLDDLPIKRGQIYNSRLWELSLLKYGAMMPDCECREDPRHLDEKSGDVTLTFDFRPCSTR
jgi:outer membrane protein assembly factor BamA